MKDTPGAKSINDDERYCAREASLVQKHTRIRLHAKQHEKLNNKPVRGFTVQTHTRELISPGRGKNT